MTKLSCGPKTAIQPNTDYTASYAAPSYAVRCWMDDNNVYSEVPSVNGPCVLKFPITEGGLAKCLALLGARHSVEGAGQTYVHRPALNKKLMAAGVTVKDMDNAEATLRKLGVIK